MAVVPSSVPPFWSREFFGFWIVPAATMLAATLINVTYISGFPGISIHWFMLVILYWASYRPEWQPAVLVFLAGLLYDLVCGAHLVGITPFLAMVAHLLLRSQSHLILAMPFWAVWLVIASIVIAWRGAEALAYGVMLDIWPGAYVWLGSATITALAFPIAALALTPLRRMVRE